MSGAVLYNNYTTLETIKSVKHFYYKRWKSIFPTYYIVYIVVFLAMVVLRPSTFKGKSLAALLWTLIGMDGYVSNAVTTWSLIGDWFIGAIVILYVLYPLLNIAFNISEIATLLISIAVFIVFINWDMLDQNAFRNIFSCILSFLIGFYVVKYKVFGNMYCVAGAVIIGIAAIIISNAINLNLSAHIVGTSLFAILFAVGRFAEKNKLISKLVSTIGSCSYVIFLIHHVIIYFVIQALNLKEKTIAILLPVMLIDVAGTVLFGYIIHRCMSRVLRKLPNNIK